MIRALVAFVALCAAAAVSAAEPKLPDLKLRYSAKWGNTSLGEVVITLAPEGPADCYRYRSVAEPIGLVRWFYGKPEETSEFCVAGGRIVPRRFEYEGTDPFKLEFDMAARKVSDGKGRVRDIPANAQDRFGLQQAVRLWAIANASVENASVEYALVDADRVRTYKFAITGREQLKIPAGTFDTLKIERTDNPKRISRYWIAPARDWMPVKVESGKDGKVQLRMELK